MMKLSAQEIKKIVESKFPDAKVTGMEPCLYTVGQYESYEGFNDDMVESGQVIACFFGSVDCLFFEFASTPSTKYLELYRASDLSITSDIQVGYPIKSTLVQNDSDHYRLENQLLTRIFRNGGYHSYTLCGYKIALEPIE